MTIIVFHHLIIRKGRLWERRIVGVSAYLLERLCPELSWRERLMSLSLKQSPGSSQHGSKVMVAHNIHFFTPKSDKIVAIFDI